jgi:hypothetical protein
MTFCAVTASSSGLELKLNHLVDDQGLEVQETTRRLAATPVSLIETSVCSWVLLDWLAGIIAPIDGDRPCGEDIQRLIEAPWPPA